MNYWQVLRESSTENEIRTKEIWDMFELRWQQEQQSKVGQLLPKRISSVIFISIR